MTFGEMSTPEDARVDLELELGDLRAELADARRLHETERRYLEGLYQEAQGRAARAERVVEAAREMVDYLDPDSVADQRDDPHLRMGAERALESLRAALAQGEESAPRCECDPDCVHCAAWRAGRGA